MTIVHCFGDDALGSLDAVGVAAAIRAGELGREEVVEAAITRVERADPLLRAVQVECFDRARSQPVTAGVFSGVPSFVKDNVDVRGLPTCYGSEAFVPHPANGDAAPARQFLAQGFVILGKSTLPEFGLTASTEYVHRAATRNPWNTEHSAGGSSGGAGALVASGAVPIAHGNDGGGSIRIPAAVNGLVGLKTTRSRLLDQAGARRLPVNLASEGVLTRSVRDTAHYLAAAERFHPHPGLETVGLVEGAADRRLRIGVIGHDVFGRRVHREIAAVLSSAAETLVAQGHDLVEMRLGISPQFIEDFKLYWALFAVLMSASFKVSHRARFRPGDLDPFTKGLARLVWRNPLGLAPAIWRLRQGVQLYDSQFSTVDVVLSPVLAHPAPKIGEYAPDQPFTQLFAKLIDYVAFTPINNVGGGPAIALPHGMMSGGLPGSVHISAPRGRERTLLELAYELEATSPFPQITTAASDSRDGEAGWLSDR
jgi:amidase